MSSKNTAITICNETIHPGESASLALPLPEIFSCAPMYMPIKVFHGKQAGPCLLVLAAMHGNELNGAEIINRLLEMKSLQQLKGTVVAVPIMNVYGFINKSATLPGGSFLDASFPGCATGSHAARLAHLFCNTIFSLADYCIDLQTGWLNHTNLPQIITNECEGSELAFAHSFGAPVLSQRSPKKGSLRAYAEKKGIPYLVYEAGEALRFDEQSIRLGVEGVLSTLRHIGAIDDVVALSQQDPSLLTRDSQWVRSPTSGISYAKVSLGQKVKKGERLAVIKDPFGAGENVAVTSPFEGVVVSVNNLPLVYEGVSLFQLASFEKLSQAATHIEDWMSDADDDTSDAQ